MTLMLHSGAEAVTYADLSHLAMPEATDTHVPIAHSAVVDMVKYSLGFFGHDIVAEHFGVTPDGHRFFGVLELQSQYGDYTDTVGLRNSHDKKFPIGISFGSKVFVCDNLAFNGDHVIRRKHTKNAKFALPSLVAEVVEPLRGQRQQQARLFDAYKHTRLTAEQVDHIIMEMYRQGIINLTRIADVLDAYEKQPLDWGHESAYRLFNAATFALTGRVTENPAATSQLHRIIDGYCEVKDTRQLELIPA